MKRIKLTAPNGSHVILNPDDIASINENVGDYAEQARSVISLISGRVQAVVETVDEVEAKMDEAK
jgi:uncharacterized protein YlzI (FlbEa/FlbD family)